MSGDWDLATVEGYEQELLGYFAQAAGIDAGDAVIVSSQDGDQVRIDFTATGTQEQMQAITSPDFAQTMENTVQAGNTDMHSYLYTNSNSSGTRTFLNFVS